MGFFSCGSLFRPVATNLYRIRVILYGLVWNLYGMLLILYGRGFNLYEMKHILYVYHKLTKNAAPLTKVQRLIKMEL